MNLRGMLVSAAAFLMTALPIRSAQETSGSSLDLTYKSEPLAGAVVDLTYPVQDMSGAALGAGGKQGQVSGGPQALQGEVADLKAAGADIKETEKEIKISLQGEILFDFDKADLRAAAQPTLTQIAALINKTSKASVVIEGYTDSKGSASYNQKLSDRRASSVKVWLAAHRIAAGKIQTRGFGAAKPVAPNKKPDGSDDPEGRQKNRRVEITIKK